MEIGGCQLCGWNNENKDENSCALDFDHITGEKYKQISLILNNTLNNILNEILKCRLLCRDCHQLYTVFNVDQKCLNFIMMKKLFKN
jgi:hypothetical protein